MKSSLVFIIPTILNLNRFFGRVWKKTLRFLEIKLHLLLTPFLMYRNNEQWIFTCWQDFVAEFRKRHLSFILVAFYWFEKNLLILNIVSNSFSDIHISIQFPIQFILYNPRKMRTFSSQTLKKNPTFVF